MSAFVHGTDHIDLMVTYLATGDRETVKGIETTHEGHYRFVELDPDYFPNRDTRSVGGKDPFRIGPDELGCLLLAQNIRSVLSRYKNADADEIARYSKTLADYRYRPVNVSRMRIAGELDRVAIVAAQSFAYQAGETEDWPATDAYRWTTSIISTAARRLANPDLLTTDAWCFHR